MAADLNDVMGIILRPVPAAQPHPPGIGQPARARLGAKQVVFWVEVVRGGQGQLSWDDVVQVPVNSNAVDVAGSMDIT